MTKEELRKVIGKNIKALRISNGMSLDDLAKILDKSPSFIGLIERGRRGATSNNLLILSEIFNVKIDEFFRIAQTDIINDETKIRFKRKCNKIQLLLSSFSETEIDYIIKGLNLLIEIKKSYQMK